MRSTRTKRSRAPNVSPTLFGPPASSAFLPKKDLPIPPSAAKPVATSASAPSYDIERAQFLLRDVLVREDSTEEVLLMDEVRDGLDQACRLLAHLRGKQLLFEFWVQMKH